MQNLTTLSNDDEVSQAGKALTDKIDQPAFDYLYTDENDTLQYDYVESNFTYDNDKQTTNSNVPAILNSLWYNEMSKHAHMEKTVLEKVDDWPKCLHFLTYGTKSQTNGSSNDSIAYLITKNTPAIVVNNKINRNFDITKLEDFKYGFYLNISLLIRSNSTEEYRILGSPNLLVLWNGNLDVILRLSDSYFYRSNSVILKSDEFHFVEISFNSLNTTLDIYLNGSKKSSSSTHSYYEPDMFAFAETMFEIGPLLEFQSMIVDNFVFINMGKNLLGNEVSDQHKININLEPMSTTMTKSTASTQFESASPIERLNSTKSSSLMFETPIRIVNFQTISQNVTENRIISYKIELNKTTSKMQINNKKYSNKGTLKLFNSMPKVDNIVLTINKNYANLFLIC